MADIVITEADRQKAEDFLEEFLTEQMPDTNLSKGSSIRDLLVGGMSLVTAYYQAQVDDILRRQSLSRVTEITDQTDQDEAVDALLSNLFITRNSGRSSSGTAILHFSQLTDVVVRTTDRLTRTAGAVYKPSALSDTAYPSSALTASYDSSGNVIDYTLRILIEAVSAGSQYDLGAGTFTSTTFSNPYLTKVEHTSDFSGGRDAETTEDLLTRAPTALTLRDLVTDRAAETVIKDTFSSIDEVTVVGMGDDEMQRDKVTTLQNTLNIHTGGHVDLYISSNIVESKTYSAVVGADFTDVRSDLTIFKDSAVTDFTTAAGIVITPVLPRMVLKINNAQTGEPTEYLIEEVNAEYIRVAANNPLPELRTAVSYSIGATSPTYVDAIAASVTGEFSNTFSEVGLIGLPNEPIYRIQDVSVNDSANPLAGTDGRVHYINRVNTTPSSTEADLEYQIIGVNPLEVPSANQVLNLSIPALSDGTTVQVTYDTIKEFSDVDTFVDSTTNRVACANMLTKAFHPVYVEGLFQYSLRPTATSDVDTTALRDSIVAYINGFSPTDVLNVSDIITHIQSTFPDISSVVPVYLPSAATAWTASTALSLGDVVKPNTLTGHYYKVVGAGTTGTTEPTWTISANVSVSDGTVTYNKIENYSVGYNLYAPDGRVIPYSTTDKIKIESAKLVNPAIDIDSLDTSTTATSISLGISDRTTRYITTADLITVLNT